MAGGRVRLSRSGVQRRGRRDRPLWHVEEKAGRWPWRGRRGGGSAAALLLGDARRGGCTRAQGEWDRCEVAALRRGGDGGAPVGWPRRGAQGQGGAARARERRRAGQRARARSSASRGEGSSARARPRGEACGRVGWCAAWWMWPGCRGARACAAAPSRASVRRSVCLGASSARGCAWVHTRRRAWGAACARGEWVERELAAVAWRRRGQGARGRRRAGHGGARGERERGKGGRNEGRKKRKGEKEMTKRKKN